MIARAAYVPAIHHGYMEFVRKTESGTFYVLSEDIVGKIPRLERDIRALGSKVVLEMLSAAYPDIQMHCLDMGNVQDIMGNITSLTLPDEDVSHVFADTYAIGVPSVKYESNFLRWDRMRALEKREPNPLILVSYEELDKMIMGESRIEATKSPDWWRQVGCTIVLPDGNTLSGHNRPYPNEHGTLEIFGDPRSSFDAGESIELSKAIHAEASLIARAARQGIALEGSDLYVTTFPCPPCAKSIVEAGISRVFFADGYSLLDAEDLFVAAGVDIIQVQDPENRQQP